jgi:DNA modification methylase
MSRKTNKTNVITQERTDRYAIYNGDSVELIKALPDASVGLSVFSPPFSSLYTYSASDRDMGNCASDDEFANHFKFLVKELFRVMQSGRLVAIHCMNLPTSKANDGYIGIKDFRGDLIRMFQAAGFIYHSEVCIWKDPVIAMQRTKALGLLHKQVVKDSAMSRQGIPDYLVVMRKPGSNDNPVAGLFELDEFAGLDKPSPSGGKIRDSIKRVLARDEFSEIEEPLLQSDDKDKIRDSINVWQRYASPVWMDINPSNTLQYMAGKHKDDNRHICPLQLDVIHRAIDLWSNPDDVVFTPFMGIGSEVYQAIKMGRRAIGFELKPSYYALAKRNIAEVSDLMSNSETPLLDLLSGGLDQENQVEVAA